MWQRAWTAETANAIKLTDHKLQGVRVLWGQFGVNRHSFALTITPHHDALRGRLVRPVFRLEGSRPGVSVQPVATAAKEALRVLESLGAHAAAIEIDHDSATARLDAYAAWLQQLRTELPPVVGLSITALPDWVGSPSLPRLLDSVDEAVVQVHAPGSIDAPLFDEALARQALSGFVRAARGTMIRVSLPTYRVKVGMGVKGDAPVVEFESPTGEHRARRHEMFASPRRLQLFLESLQRGAIPGVDGVLWFRLPQATDRHALSSDTFTALLAGESLESALDMRFEPTPDSPDTFDITLGNDGRHDGVLDTPMPWPPACVMGDALAGWRIEANAFVSESPAGVLVRAGESRRVGWLRCPALRERVVQLPH